jgi:hypothetical protein
MPKVIKLTRGKVTIVDDDDYELLSLWKWHCTSAGYAARRNPRTRGNQIVLLHRFITDAPEGKSVDHINGNPLDNRKANLRLVTHSENLHNRPKQANNTSGHKGVAWSITESKWKGFIGVKGKRIHVGTFTDKQAAIEAVIKKRIELCGEVGRH